MQQDTLSVVTKIDSSQQSDLQYLVEPLLSWYDRGHRILPWRSEPTPYRVWISEIMLQQTRVEAVKPYFERFMSAFPDVASLAVAEEDHLLKMWEGLGYYNRARNLQKAAIRIMKEYGGQIPGEYDRLMDLPGIGSYTAGAISSIAFGARIPAVDGNVLRILSRVRCDERDIALDKVKRSVALELMEVMPKERSGDVNQAMMELGAMVCIPKGDPKCEGCPWNAVCKARQAGKIFDYPKKTAAKKRTIEKKTVLIVQDENRTAIRRRPDRGLLAGMYEFPMLDGHCTEKEVVLYLRNLGFGTIRITPIEDAKHIFSHKEWHMCGFAIRVDELDLPQKKGMESGFLFADRNETEDKYPIPSAFAAYAKYIHVRLGNEKYKNGET